MTLNIPELRALVAAATPGPWAYEDDGTIGGIFVRPPAGRPHRHDSAADAAFIAASRSAIPALLDRVEALGAALREALAIAHSTGDFCADLAGCGKLACHRLEELQQVLEGEPGLLTPLHRLAELAKLVEVTP